MSLFGLSQIIFLDYLEAGSRMYYSAGCLLDRRLHYSFKRHFHYEFSLRGQTLHVIGALFGVRSLNMLLDAFEMITKTFR